MTSAPRRSRRRSIGSLLAGALTAAALAVTGVGLAPDAGSVAGVDFSRLSGADRYATAAAVATETFTSATFALLVSGENFADAVSSSYLAGVSDAPILLTRRDQVPAPTIAALQALSVDLVVIVGGPDAISPGVGTQLTSAGFPNARVAGANRYETAKNVSFVTGSPTVGSNEIGKRTAIVASGQTFPDALAAGPIAYDDGFPLLLTERDSLHPAAEQALVTLQITHVLITGGPAAIGTAIEQRLAAMGITSERLEGPDRYGTAQAIATKATSALGHSDSHVDIATGESFPDALSGGPHAGSRHGVILLTRPAAASAAACGFLDTHAATVTSGHILGGEQAVLPAVETALEGCAAGEGGPLPGPGPDANIDFAASPETGRVSTLGGEGTSLTWAFSGVDTVVDVALVPCFAVDRQTGRTTFGDDPIPLDGTFQPDTHDSAMRRTDYLGQSYRSLRLPAPAGAAQIIAVNGAVAPTSYVDGFAAPAGGTLSVTATATGSDCVVPLVFGDPADDDALALDAEDRATDDFGVGGAGAFTIGEAPEDTPVAGEVMYADEANDSVILANGFRYDYGDAGDTYRYEEFFLNNLGEFEFALSQLDTLGLAGAPFAYNRTDANRFDLGGDVGASPSGVAGTASDFDDVAADSANNDVLLSFAPPGLPDAVVVDYGVDVYRCAVTCVLVRQALDSDHEPASAVPPVNQDVNNDNIDDDVNGRVVVEDLEPGSYRFVVSAITFTGQRSVFGSGPSALVASAGAGSPRSTQAVFIEAGPANGIVGPGDILRVTFDEVMQPPDVGDSITVQSGTIVTNLVHGPNFTFAIVGEVLSITVLNEVVGNQLAFAGLQALTSTGVTDTDGIEWDIAGSPDRTFG